MLGLNRNYMIARMMESDLIMKFNIQNKEFYKKSKLVGASSNIPNFFKSLAKIKKYNQNLFYDKIEIFLYLVN